MSHEKDRAAHHGDPAQPLSNPTKDCSPEHISPSAELFDNTLQYGDDEHVSITYRDNPDAPVTAAIVAAPDTGRYLREQVPPAADVWFGVNPVAGPARQGKNGAADDVTRLQNLQQQATRAFVKVQEQFDDIEEQLNRHEKPTNEQLLKAAGDYDQVAAAAREVSEQLGQVEELRRQLDEQARVAQGELDRAKKS